MYLAVPGLSFCMRDPQSLLWLCGIFSCGMHIPSYGMWDLVPWPRIKPGPPALEAQGLATGKPGKYRSLHFHVVKMHYPFFSPIAWVFVFYLKKPEQPEYLKEQKTGRADDRAWKQISPSFLLFSYFFYYFSIFPYPEIDVSNKQIRLLCCSDLFNFVSRYLWLCFATFFKTFPSILC